MEEQANSKQILNSKERKTGEFRLIPINSTENPQKNSQETPQNTESTENTVKMNNLRTGTPEEISKRARELGKRNKGKKKKLSALKQKIGKLEFDSIIEKIDSNIEEFINHENLEIRYSATKDFADYFKPKKKEHNINLKGQIIFNVNNQIQAPIEEME